MSEAGYKHTPIWDSVIIISISLVLGCPIVGVSFAFSAFAVSFFSDYQSDYGKILGSLPIFILFSYPLGFVLALSSSIGIAIYVWIFKKLTALAVLVITFVIVTLVISYFSESYRELISGSGPIASYFVMICSLIAAYFSYRIYYNGLSISKVSILSKEKKGEV